MSRQERANSGTQASVVSLRPPPDPQIFELFRVEVEGSSALLGRGLVKLEAGDAGKAEELMRAAHSIKGAARIVGIDAVAQLAHALEDCFVALQEGRLGLGNAATDLLLEAVDVLASIATTSAAEVPAWLARHLGPAADLVERVAALARGETPAPQAISIARASGKPVTALAPAPHPSAPAGDGFEPAAPEAAPPEAAPQRVVRVTAQSINRLMGLAGESLVEARRVQAVNRALLRLKQRQSKLGAVLESLERHAAAPELKALLADAKLHAGECRELLLGQMAELDDYARRVDDLSERLYREALKSRMRPFGDGVHGFPRMVRDVARQLGKSVKLEISGEGAEVDRDVLEGLDAPLNHLLRNAVDHGVEPEAERLAAGKPAVAVIRVQARHHAGMLAITVADDGRGIDLEKLRRKVVERSLVRPDIAGELGEQELLEFIFLPGFSTASSVTEISGRGVGLDVVRSAVEAASGTVKVTSRAGVGTTFHLELPVTRSVMRAVVAEVAGEAYAFPLLRIRRVLRVAVARIETLGSSEFFVEDGENVALVNAQQVLGFSAEVPEAAELCVVVVSDGSRSYGVAVDRFLGEHDLFVRPLDARLGKVQDVAAAAILMDGRTALILDVDDLLRSIEKLAQIGRLDPLKSRADAAGARARKRILVVEDSITVREAERQLLVNLGYAVDVAVDGVDGWNSVRGASYDLVISDIDMPRMNGLDLVRTIRQEERFARLPVVIVSYKDRPEDRLRGLDAGANYYLTKSSFHDETLVRAVEDLIGSPEA